MGQLVEIPSSRLCRALENALSASGATARDAEHIADHLVRNELAGYRSHGLSRLPRILDLLGAGDSAGDDELSIEQSAHGCWLVEGSGRIGIAAVASTVDALVNARPAGVIVAAVRGYRGTTGRLGAYVEDLAEAGYASIAMCNSDFAVAPHGGRRAILGTNPLAFGIDGTATRIVSDVATAAMSYGAIKDLERRGESLPDGVVLDEEGRASNNPADADEGAQLPMSGHKGFALGLAVELFAGPLIGAKGGRDAVPGSDGTLIVSVALDAFVSENTVRQGVEAVVEEIRSAPLAQGFDHIAIPGDRAVTGRRLMQDDALVAVGADIAAALGLDD